MLAKCRSIVIEWFVEFQQGKPKAPSLSQLSFEKRQVQKRTEHTQHLATLTTTSQIIAFGCNILKEDDSILQAFLGSIFSQLCEFASEEVESALRQDRANLQFAALAPFQRIPSTWTLDSPQSGCQMFQFLHKQALRVVQLGARQVRQMLRSVS